MRIQILVLCLLVSCFCLKAQLMMETVQASDTATFFYNIEGEESIQLTVAVVGDKLIAGGDMIVGSLTDLNTGRGGALTRDPNSRWPNGIIPYEIASDHPLTNQINAAYQDLSNRTNLTIIPRDSTHTQYVYIDKKSANGCRCQVGMQAGITQMNLSPRCNSQGTIQHEMLHAAGFFHEQMRRDREDYIKIMWDNIKSAEKHNFNTYKYGEATALGKYDYESIMQYSGYTNDTKFAKDVNKPIITTIDPVKQDLLGSGTLSDNDIRQINRVYQANGSNNAFTSRGGNTDEFIDSKIDENDYPLLNKYNHEYTIDLVPQVTGVTCWAASTAMIIGWLDNVNVSVQEIVDGVGYWAQYDNEKYSIDRTLSSFDLNMFEVWGLVPDTRYNFSLETLSDLLWNYGPLWVASDEELTGDSSPEGHIRVIGGISGDGTEEGTLLTIYDPWDRNSTRFRRGNNGSVYQETYSEFISKMRHLIKKEKSKDAIYLAHP